MRQRESIAEQYQEEQMSIHSTDSTLIYWQHLHHIRQWRRDGCQHHPLDSVDTPEVRGAAPPVKCDCVTVWLCDCDMWAGGERASCERECVEGWSWTLDTIWWDSVLSCSSSRHNDNMRPAPHHDTPPHSSSHAQGGRHGLRRPGHGAARQVGHGGRHLRLQQHEYQPSGKYIRLYWKYFLMDYTSSALIKFLMDHSITEESE